MGNSQRLYRVAIQRGYLMGCVWGNIYWHQFDWPSFATLTTGALAVLAAMYVGKKQTKISERQVELEEATLRADLFDRRMAVYESAATMLQLLPQGRGQSDETRAAYSDYFPRMREGQFLFKDPAVRTMLTAIWARASDHETDLQALRTLDPADDRLSNEQAGAIAAQLRAARKRAGETASWVIEQLDALPEVFGTDLSIMTANRRGS